MKILFFVVVILSVTPYSVCSQGVSSHQTTTPPSDHRFEIIQSQLAAKWTFRLDRFTGQVSQLGNRSVPWLMRPQERNGRSDISE